MVVRMKWHSACSALSFWHGAALLPGSDHTVLQLHCWFSSSFPKQPKIGDSWKGKSREVRVAPECPWRASLRWGIPCCVLTLLSQRPRSELMSPCPPGTTNWTLPGTTEVEVVMGAASESVVQYRTAPQSGLNTVRTLCSCRHTQHTCPRLPGAEIW